MLWPAGALLLGMAYGALLQRARFCFVSAIRDWFIFRSWRVTVGICAGLLVSTLGFAVLSLVWQDAGVDPRSRLWILPLGLNTLAGGVLFGFGMVMAGGCASGTLFRIGEGYAASAVALAAMIGVFPLGLWLQKHTAFLQPSLSMGEAWLPRGMGLLGAVLFTLVVFGVLFVLAGRGATDPDASRPWLRRLPWLVILAGAALGALNTLQTALDRPWGISEPFFWLSSTGGDLQAFVDRALVKTRISPLLLDVGLILGSFASALAAKEWRWRLPGWRRLLQAGAGGAIMGIGIAFAFGCNIGGVFSGLPSLSLTAWVYLAALILGVWLAIKALRLK